MMGRRQDGLLMAILVVLGGTIFGGVLLGFWLDDETKITASAVPRQATLTPKPTTEITVPETTAPEPLDKTFDRHFRAGIDLLKAGRYEDAAAMFRLAQKRNPHVSEVHVNLGFSLLAANKSRAAEQSFRKSLAIRREQINAYYGLAESLEQQGRMAEALGAMRTFIHLTADDNRFRRRARAAVWEWQNPVSEKSAPKNPKQGVEPEAGK